MQGSAPVTGSNTHTLGINTYRAKKRDYTSCMTQVTYTQRHVSDRMIVRAVIHLPTHSHTNTNTGCKGG